MHTKVTNCTRWLSKIQNDYFICTSKTLGKIGCKSLIAIMVGKAITLLNHAVYFLMLDMSIAFDTVDRTILLKDLRHHK